MKCNSCGNELREGARFCSFCGEKVSHENISANTKNVWKHRTIVIFIICLAIALFAFVLTMLLKNAGKIEEKILEAEDDSYIEKTTDVEPVVELQDEVDHSHILYSDSYYISDITGILSAISECKTDNERIDFLEKYCITERTEMINAEDSLFYYSADGNNDFGNYIEYGRTTEYTYDDDDNLLSTHSYYKDGFLVRESIDEPLQLNYQPSYDFTDENREKINIILKDWNDKEASVILGNESKGHLEQFFNEDNNYTDFDNCRSELEYNGYSLEDVETVYVNCEVTSYFDADDLVNSEVKWTSSDAYGDIIKLKDGTWLFGCYEGGSNYLDIYYEERLVATVSYSEQDTSGSVTFYYYDKKAEDDSYNINPLYFDFLEGKIPAKSSYEDPYFISENPRTKVYFEDSQSGVFFIDLDNDGEFEMHILDYSTGTCGIVFNIDNGELIEWTDGGPIVNGPLYNDMNWVKYDDAAWIYSTAERSDWGILMEKYSGTDIVDSFEIMDKRLEDGETHNYLYRNQIISEEEFKNIYKEIFKHEYWGY